MLEIPNLTETLLVSASQAKLAKQQLNCLQWFWASFVEMPLGELVVDLWGSVLDGEGSACQMWTLQRPASTPQSPSWLDLFPVPSFVASWELLSKPQEWKNFCSDTSMQGVTFEDMGPFSFNFTSHFGHISTMFLWVRRSKPLKKEGEASSRILR